METLSHKIGTPDDVTNVNSAKTSAEIAFTSALYNSFAIAFMIIAILLCGLLLIVLQAFVRSMLWAVLTGAFLFKFKRYSTDITREHLKLIEANDASLLFNLFMLPLKLVDSTSDYVFNFCVKKYRQLGYLIISVVTFKLIAIFYDHVVVYIWYMFDILLEATNIFAYFVDNCWQITFTILIAYLFGIAFYWRDDYKPIFKILSIPIWICFSILISQYLGSFRVLFVIAAIILILLGVVSFIKEQIIKHKKKLMKVKADILGDESMKSDDDDLSLDENKLDSTTLNESNNQQENEQQTRPNSLNITNSDDKVNDNAKPEASASNKSRILERSVSTSFYNYNSKSDKYFYLLFWLFLGLRLWSFSVLLAAVFIFLWKFIKFVLIRLVNFLYKRFEIEKIIVKSKDWIAERQEVLAPRPLNVVYRLFIKGDHKLNEWLQTSLDTIVSALMIFALLVCLISGLVILAMQVHSESLQLISITSNVVNEKLYSQPQLQEWLPEKEKVNELFQTAINNFYVYGREWLSNRLKNLATTTADQEMIENKLLTQWDLLYTFLMQKTSNITTNNTVDVHMGSNTTLSSHMLTTTHNRTVLLRQRSFDLKNTWNFILNKENFDYSYLIDVIKGNIGILVSLLDSIYLVLKSNINILFTLIQLFVSLLFQSGFALLNFFISLIVYLTALFYLLSASDKRYKPIQWINEITIIKGNRGHLMSKAIEESIRSVFVASLKMATFYGLYTWIIHNLFSLNIVYLPSITAALFGFLPILGTYWTCLPGVLELWLLQKEPFYALLFIVCNILPTYVVDMAIYSDIKGGHPYLTGLAIAGGLYCLGLEGALIGPIVLCLFIVIIKMNKELLSLNILKQ